MPRRKQNPQSLKQTVSTAIKKIVWRVAIYIRLSKDDGNDESYSVKNQRERLNDTLEQLMLDEDGIEFVGYYIDDGFTGVDSDRDDFQRLLTDIHNGKVNCVLVKDLSRLSRNDWECKYYLQMLFVKMNVRFISLELPKLDSFKRPEGVYELDVSFQSMYNENHCRETSIKVRGTLDKKREKGQFIGAFAPYGYLKDPEDYHHLVVNPETAPVVKDIFRWYMEGMSKSAITKELIRLGISSPYEYKRQHGMKCFNPQAVKKGGVVYWSTRTVDQILHNPTYIGDMVQGRHKVTSYKIHDIIPVDEADWFWVEGTHEAIIDADTFQKVQDLMSRNTRVSPKRNNLYLFSGFLRCADCGRGMVRNSAHGYTYYSCRTYRTLSKDLCTGGSHNIKEDIIAEAALKAIQAQIALVENMAEVIKEINSAPTRISRTIFIDNLLKDKERELQKTAGISDSLYMDWKNGDITREEYHRMKARFQTEAEQLKQAIANLQEERKEYEKEVTTDDPYLTTFLKYKNIKELDRNIVVDLIDVIYIHADKGVEIHFKFQDQHKRLMEFIDNNLAAARRSKIKAV